MNIQFPDVQFPTDYPGILHRITLVDPLLYGSTRNYLHGTVTYLSPYLSRGVISTRQVYDAMLAKGYHLADMEVLVIELAWRDYFQQVWKNLGQKIFDDIKQPQTNVLHHGVPLALIQASTGITAIDEGIKHLMDTGYMHNHLRMYTASAVCNVGRYHCKMPAQWMYHHLLDGDLASNHCSWQWVAGSFSSKKYFCNQQNINKYTGSTQAQSFLDIPYASLPNIKIPQALAHYKSFEVAVPLPESEHLQIDPQLPLFIYNSYQLNPKWRSHEAANRILLLEPSHFSNYPVSKKVLDFILALSKNILGIQLFVGEVEELIAKVGINKMEFKDRIFSREHPAFAHYPGSIDSRDWLVPEVEVGINGFFPYWKKLLKNL